VMPLEPEQALAELGRLIASGVPQAAIANVDWPRLAASAAGAFSGSLLSEVLPSSATRAPAPSASGPSELLGRIRAALPDGRRSLLAKHVQAEVAAVLGLEGLSPAQIPVSFAELGMNSLMAVELRNRLEANTGCRLPTVAIFNYPTADALTDYLGDALGLSADDSSPPAPAHDAASSAASRIAELSEAEVEALLLKTIEQIQ
jgi:acyl carrier protein